MLVRPPGHSRNGQLRFLSWSAKPGGAISRPERKKLAGQAKLGALPSGSPAESSHPQRASARNKTQDQAFPALHQHRQNHKANPTRVTGTQHKYLTGH